ncbi:MAG: hypothetical protein CSA31_00475 [Desulfobulbus propionicus]|nr:MAG: hypothetical protein CSA31_00475 [Desulfobulbus propionicus]
MKRGHVPLRTCLGCRTRKPQRDMMRFCYTENLLTVDKKRVLPGRGLYCCNDKSCLLWLENNTKVVQRVLRRDGRIARK